MLIKKHSCDHHHVIGTSQRRHRPEKLSYHYEEYPTQQQPTLDLSSRQKRVVQCAPQTYQVPETTLNQSDNLQQVPNAALHQNDPGN